MRMVGRRSGPVSGLAPSWDPLRRIVIEDLSTPPQSTVSGWPRPGTPLGRVGRRLEAILRELGMASETVRRLAEATNVQEHLAKPLEGRASSLDDFKPYLHERFDAGTTSALALHREIRYQGYCDSYGTVAAVMCRHDTETGGLLGVPVDTLCRPGRQAHEALGLGRPDLGNRLSYQEFHYVPDFTTRSATPVTGKVGNASLVSASPPLRTYDREPGQVRGCAC